MVLMKAFVPFSVAQMFSNLFSFSLFEDHHNSESVQIEPNGPVKVSFHSWSYILNTPIRGLLEHASPKDPNLRFQ